MSITVDLLTPHLAVNDATSNHTRLLQKVLAKKGIKTRIIVEEKVTSDDVVPLDGWQPDGDLVLLQHFIGSDIAQYIIDKKIQVVLNYHNITPPGYFRHWELQTAHDVSVGRQQLDQLVPLTRCAITDSDFNAQELRQLNFRDVVISPVLWDLDINQDMHPRNEISAIPEDGGTMLFVGRLAPNKCQHDLISGLAMLSRRRPNSRLIFVGDSTSLAYFESLRVLARQFGIYDRVTFTGKVTADDLVNCYRSADLFVCTSEHEGFGVPLAEAMSIGLPIVAYDAAAVGETLNGAGLLLSDKRPLTLATAFDRVLGDDQLRTNLRDRGIQAAKRFDISVTGEQMWNSLKDLLPV